MFIQIGEGFVYQSAMVGVVFENEIFEDSMIWMILPFIVIFIE